RSLTTGEKDHHPERHTADALTTEQALFAPQPMNRLRRDLRCPRELDRAPGRGLGAAVSASLLVVRRRVGRDLLDRPREPVLPLLTPRADAVQLTAEPGFEVVERRPRPRMSGFAEADDRELSLNAPVVTRVPVVLRVPVEHVAHVRARLAVRPLREKRVTLGPAEISLRAVAGCFGTKPLDPRGRKLREIVHVGDAVARRAVRHAPLVDPAGRVHGRPHDGVPVVTLADLDPRKLRDELDPGGHPEEPDAAHAVVA